MDNPVRQLLEDVKSGKTSVDEAVLKLKKKPFEDLDFAKIDLHRSLRQGVAEVIYGESKTAEQIEKILAAMQANGQERTLITRLDEETCARLKKSFDIDYYLEARIGLTGGMPEPDGNGIVVVVTAGTSDLPVAEEAAITAQALGNEVKRIYDVGVSGLHRLLSRLDEIMSASVIIAVAGMEGALASVVGGLADCPVIAVPTSVGYGASFDGLAALLAMLNSCSSGVTAVNIDNGFGAGYSAHLINHAEVKK